LKKYYNYKRPDLSKYIVPSHQENKRLQALYPWSIGIFIALIIASFFFAEGKWKDLLSFSGFAVGLFSVTQTIRKRGKEHFIRADEDALEWLLTEEDPKIAVPITDIKWIKQEMDGSFTVARKSSASAGFSLKQFHEVMKEEIIGSIQQIAAKQSVNLINFPSAPKGCLKQFNSYSLQL